MKEGKKKNRQVTEVATERQVPRWLIWPLLVVTYLIFRSAVDGAITYMDDDMYLIRNPYIRDFSLHGVFAIFTNFYEYNYHPLTTLTYLFQFHFWGLNPEPYHLVNVLLHLANTYLVWLLAYRLSGKSLTAIIVATLFAVHPMHVETVAWISERKGLLCGLFYLWSLSAFVAYRKGGSRRQVLCVVLFVAALLSKSAAVTLPVVAVLIDWYLGHKRTSKDLVLYLPMFALSVFFGVLAIMSQQGGGAMNNILADYSVFNRAIVLVGGLALYFVKLVAPVQLNALYFLPDTVNGSLPWTYYASIVLLIAIGIGVWKAGKWRKEAVFGVLFFLLSISVMLQLIPVGAAVAAERYSYISYVWLFYFVAQAVAGIDGSKRRIAVWGVGIVGTVFAVLTMQRVPVWADTETLFADILEKNKGNSHSYLVYFHRGDYRQATGNIAGAMADYDTTISMNPKYGRALLLRGELYESMGKPDSAAKDYRAAIVQSPRVARAYSDLGWVTYLLKDTIGAEQWIDSALKIDKSLAVAYNNRGWIKLEKSDTTGALMDFDRAIKASPFFDKPYFNRALIHVYGGKIKAAIEDYTILLQHDPYNALAYYNRGLAWVRLNDRVEAVSDFGHAADLGYRPAEGALRELRQ